MRCFLLSGIFSFCFLCTTLYAQAPEFNSAVPEFTRNILLKKGFSPEIVQEARISDDYTSRGIHHTYLQQYYAGIPVFNALLTLASRENEPPFITGDRFIREPEAKIASDIIIKTPEDAVLRAANSLGIALRSPLQRLDSRFDDQQRLMKALLTDGGISRDPIPVSLTWFINGNGLLELAWNLVIHETDNENWWEIRVNANDGRVLDSNNWTVSCQWDAGEGSDHYRKALPAESYSVPTANLPAFLAANDYNVYDILIESPDHGSRTIVNSPWDRAGLGDPAVTHQWHYDGTTNYTITRGNNVFAYEDQDGDNNTIGYSPASGILDFNFPIDLTMPPATYMDAALANLFFWNNTCHDVFYKYGFDEVSGNFQEDNLSRGGAENDLVHAHGLDGGGTNNANFSTPPDGQTGRMQMYLWPNTEKSVFATPIGMTSNVGFANFGPTSFDLFAELVLINDGVGNITDGCTAFGGVSGKIALIDRNNTCTFINKIQNAQDAGAVGVIIANNTSGTSNMNGVGAITIPSLMVSQADGNALKTALMSDTIMLTMFRNTLTKDGSLDNGIVTHEYAHGVSTRLTGGPSISSCLNNKEQMGEGWSDYFALMLTTNWATADKNDLRPIGTFAKNQPVSGAGVRAYPYSYDLVASPYDYDYVMANGTPYPNGSVWCAMLWDMTWEIIEILPPSLDMYNGNGGNNIALQLVVEAMKLQPCNPGLEDGRDAILLADKLLYNGAYRCAIWKAFARRGMGKNADQGSPFTQTDGQSDTMLPEVIFHIDNIPVENIETPVTFNLVVDNVCNTQTALEIVATLPQGLDYISGGTYDMGSGEISFPPFAMAPGQSVTHTFQAKIATPITPPVYYFNDDVEDAPKWTPSGSFITSGIHTASGANAWQAEEPDIAATSTLTMNAPIALPLTGNLSLLFWHQGMIEPAYDGGVVEISIDNGANWIDLGPEMTENGYIAPLANTDNAAFSTNTPVFTGIYEGRMTRVNLNAYAGQNILIRFRFGTDTGNAGAVFEGWFIDNILIVADDIPVFTIPGEISASGNSLCTTSSTIRAKYDVAFPVELLGFDAVVVDNKSVLLSWQTETELDNDYFTVERSKDAQNFEDIGQVKGAGTSTIRMNYTLMDESPLAGTGYYRLKQTDFNGDITFSDIRAVEIRKGDQLFAYPNPAGDFLQVQYISASENNGMLVLYNSLGQQVMQVPAPGSGMTQLDIRTLPSGFYALAFHGAASTTQIKIQKK